MVFDAAIPHRIFLPAATTCQTASHAFIRAVWNLKTCFNTAVIHKRRTPQSIRFLDIPFRKMSDNRFKIGVFSFNKSMKRLQSFLLRNLCQFLSCRFHNYLHKWASLCISTTLRTTRNGLDADLSIGQIVRYRPRRAGDERLSPGQSHLDGSSPYPDNKKEDIPNGMSSFLATSNGLEPSTSSVTGWRANRLHHEAIA